MPAEPATATISALRPLPSQPSVRSVLVDGTVIARLSESDIESLKLAVGQPWTDEVAAAVQAAAATHRARRDALRALGRRGLSRHELHQRLERREHDPGIIERVLAEMESQGWIDDAECARLHVEQILARGPASEARLRSRLAARGIEEAVASSVVAEALRDDDPVASALEIARRALGRGKSRDGAATVRRVAGALARQGFTEEVVETVIHRLDLLARDDEA